jgi:hypothetical protein
LSAARKSFKVVYGPFFHGGNTGSNPVGDANETFVVVNDVLRVDWAFSINNKQTIEVVQKEAFLVVTNPSRKRAL